MDKMEELWVKLQLTATEEVEIEIQMKKLEQVQEKGVLYLIGKLWVDRVINKWVIKSVMGKVRHPITSAIFREARSNVFIISFATIADKNRVASGWPWLFDNNIFVLEQFYGLRPLKDMEFDKASLWVQLHQLPLFGMHRIVHEMVCNSLEKIEDVEVEKGNVGWGKKLYMRVHMDLTKPLAREEGKSPLWEKSFGSLSVTKNFLKYVFLMVV